MSVKQSIKVTNAGLSPILSVAQGTGAIEYEFTVSDFDIPSGSAAVVYNIQPTGNIVSQTCSISGNTITVKPPAYYFLRGKNYMQFQVSRSNEDLFSFLIEVWCAPNISQPEVIVAENPSLVSQLISDVGLLSSQLDNLLSIPSGSLSTSADAALADIKVGWNGTTYDTPGDAVRGQIGELNDDLSQLGETISDISLFDFVRASYYNYKINPSVKFRISMPNYVSFNYEIEIKAKDGFKFVYMWQHTEGTGTDEYGNTVYVSSAVTSATILPNTKFRISIFRATEDSSEIADFEEFKRGVHVTNVVDRIFKKYFGTSSELKNNTPLSSYPDKCISVYQIPMPSDFPTKTSGILTTFRNGQDAFSYQEWKPFNKNEKYVRNWLSSSEHTGWKKIITSDDSFRYANKCDHSQRVPLISFISDDGHNCDYTILKPIADKYKVPFATAVITSQIGVGDHMDATKLRDLYDNYMWEFLSHTHNHVKLGEQTDNDVRNECKLSISTLENIGIECKGIVYPQGNSSIQSRQVCKEFFNFGIRVEDSSLTVNDGCVPSFYIHRCNLGCYFDPEREGYSPTNTLDYYKELVDECVRKKGWLIFELHSWHTDFDATQQQHLDNLIAYIKTTSASISKPSIAFEMFRNQIESGDYLGYRNTTGLAINKLGEMNYGYQPAYLDQTEIKATTPITDFPLDKTSTYAISNYYNPDHGFPTSYGTLEVRRYRTNDFATQLWYSSVSDEIYYRRCLADGAYQQWHKFS